MYVLHASNISIFMKKYLFKFNLLHDTNDRYLFFMAGLRYLIFLGRLRYLCVLHASCNHLT